MKVWIRRSVIERFRKLGALNGSLLLADRLLGALSSNHARIIRYYLAAQPVPSISSDAQRPASSSPVRRANGGDPIVTDFPRPPEVIAARFAAGSRCYVAKVRGQFAGYLWLAFGGYNEDEVRCRYEFAEPNICAWDYDVYVVPAFRLGRTFARLWDAANQDLAGEGFRWSFSRISAFNPGSLAAHRRMGMEILFSATFICLGRVQFALIGASPFLHLSWSGASRPVLTLQLPKAT